MSKSYELKIIEDLLGIPEDRFDMFLVDLKKWHGAARAIKNLLDTIAATTGEEQPKERVTMCWIDDGKHDGKVIVIASSADEEKL